MCDTETFGFMRWNKAVRLSSSCRLVDFDEMFQIFLLFLFTLAMMHPCNCKTYDQHKQLMAGGKLVLSWSTDEEMFHFKLSGHMSGYVGLAFSYNSLPVDGFVAGLDDAGEIFAVDLHLDYAGMKCMEGTIGEFMIGV